MMRFVRVIVIAGAGFLLAAVPAMARDPKAEIDFVTRAADGDLLSLAESELAVDRATDPDVKAFARELADAHRKADAALRTAAAGSGAMVPLAMDQSHQARLAKLQDEMGTAFDKAFVAEQAEVHSNALTLYADYMLLGEHLALKDYATRMIPVTEKQFKEAQALSGR